MLKWAVFFFLISLVSGAMGFMGVASAAAGIAKLLFFVSITLCALFLIAGLLIGQRIGNAFRNRS